MGKVLLLEIGAGDLPALTPTTAPGGTWMPIPYQAPPPAVPGGFAVTAQLGGVKASWNASSEPRAIYEVERAPDVAGSPGTSKVVYSGTDLVYNSNESARTHWRVRVKVRGLVGTWSAWVAQSPDDPLNYVGGNGVNLLPDIYSTLESTTIPATTRPLGGTFTRDAANKRIVASQVFAGAANVACYLGSSLGNIKLTPGKRYIVSAWSSSAQAGNTFKFFLETQGGIYYYSPELSMPGGGAFNRVSALLDLSANTQVDAWLGYIKQQSESMWLDGLMVEEAVGNLNQPSAYARGQTASVAIGAFAAAAAAQDTADGKIDTFYLPSAPPIGSGAGQASLGDLWFNTADGNKQHRCNGTTWVVVQDTAIGLAISNAAGAQATADGKVRTWFAASGSPPTASAVGDLWYVTDQATLKRWSGSAWVLVADNAAETLNDYVANAKFEQGMSYWTLQVGWRSASNPSDPFSGTTALCADGGLSPGVDSRAWCDKLFSVAEGEVFIVSAMVNQLAPNGSFGIGLLFYNAAGGLVTVREEEKNAAAWGLAFNVYKKIATRVVVPAGVVQARYTTVRYGHSTGYWLVDNVAITKMPTNLDDVPDSPTYAKPRAVTLNNGVPLGLSGGQNLVPNFNLVKNLSARPTNAFFTSDAFICDGWFATDNFTYVLPYKEVGGSTNVLLQRFRSDATLVASQPYTAQSVHSETFEVQAGREYDLYAAWSNGRTVTPPAGFDGLIRYLVQFYDGNKNPISPDYFDASLTTVGTYDYHKRITAPGGAKYAVLYIQIYVRNTTASAITPSGQLWADVRTHQVGVYQTANLDNEVSHGTLYGRVSNNDLIDNAGVRRIGLRLSASGHRLGSQRNTVRAQTSTYGSVRSTTALSATSAGVVNVNAHTVRYGSFNVAYNAVSNAVTGLTQGATYVIYCYDGDYSGGTKTYYAGTNPDSIMQLGDDVIVIGQITIPTSGSSSGGGGGTGTNPGDWCVAEDSFLPDGTFAGDLPVGAMLPCYNNRPEAPNIVHLRVQANRAGESECLRMVTASGASIVASVTTPMTLRDGSCVLLPDMLHRDALVYRRDGTFTWERVTTLEPAGMRRVAKISVSDQCYFAGETVHAFIATHNVQQMKP